MDDSRSQSSSEAGLLDDTAELVMAAVDKAAGEPLDEGKVKLRIEELQSEMIELAKSQVCSCVIERRSRIPEGCAQSHHDQQQNIQQNNHRA